MARAGKATLYGSNARLGRFLSQVPANQLNQRIEDAVAITGVLLRQRQSLGPVHHGQSSSLRNIPQKG